jgi:HlyD family secretion protein
MKTLQKLRPLLWIVPGAAAVAGIGYVRAQPVAVMVVQPARKQVTETIAASGTLRGQIETDVGAQSGGRVLAVLVREGDVVRTGQIIARLDDEVLQAEVSQAAEAVGTARAQRAQAENAVETARAALEQTARPPLAADVARLRADVLQSTATAEARLLLARQRLAELEAGPVAEEREQAEAKVREAEATLADAERDRDRQQRLYEQGAVARANYETAATKAEVALRGLESARSRLRQVTNGTRPEQIAQARAEVKVAEATLAGAKASGEQQIRALLSQPRPEDVRLARRRLEEAAQARTVAEQRLREAERAVGVAERRRGDAVVRAPFDGTVTRILTETGGVTGPNQPLLRLVRTATPEIEVELEEANLGRVRLGQQAVVTPDAYPDRKLTAKVSELGAQVDAQRGTVRIRLTPDKTPSGLRPGLTLSVNIIVDAGSERLVLPLTAVNTLGGTASVLVVERGSIVKRTVRVGPPGEDSIPVLSGLTAGEQVVINPTGRKPGEKVRPETADTKANSSTVANGEERMPVAGMGG